MSEKNPIERAFGAGNLLKLRKPIGTWQSIEHRSAELGGISPRIAQTGELFFVISVTEIVKEKWTMTCLGKMGIEFLPVNLWTSWINFDIVACSSNDIERYLDS